MTNRMIVLALCCAMSVGAILPLAQAGHYTLYNAGMHREFGSFELTTSDWANQNGPAADDTRAIPADPDVPARFVGLADILQSDITFTGASGTAIFDHQMYGSVVEAGNLVPTHYYISNNDGTPRTMPASMHAVWWGYWNDANTDGIIDDYSCSGNALNCAADDEFVWRGANTGEGLEANAWIFPGDYDGSTGSGGHIEPSAFAGDCGLYGSESTDCVSPAPDMAYADSTISEANLANQRWAGNNGGGQWTPEEFLLVSQHIVSIGGPSALVEASTYGFKVECTGDVAGDQCFRDYDWYNSVADDATEAQYLSTMRGVRDAVWVPLEHVNPDLGVSTNVCPTAVPSEDYGCFDYDQEAHNTASQADGGSLKRVFHYERFATVVPAYTNTPPTCVPTTTTCVGAQGFYGDFDVERDLIGGYSHTTPGGFVRPELFAYFWDDLNGDGYIGEPTASDIAAYNAGLLNNPNNGQCQIGTGAFCELLPAANVFGGKTVSVAPGAAGWPPGTLVFRTYESGMWAFILSGGGPGWVEQSTPAFGTTPVGLAADAERCKSQYFGCRTIDAIFIPSGGALGLTGSIAGGITFNWEESTVAKTKNFAVSFSGAI